MAGHSKVALSRLLPPPLPAGVRGPRAGRTHMFLYIGFLLLAARRGAARGTRHFPRGQVPSPSRRELSLRASGVRGLGAMGSDGSDFAAKLRCTPSGVACPAAPCVHCAWHRELTLRDARGGHCQPVSHWGTACAREPWKAATRARKSASRRKVLVRRVAAPFHSRETQDRETNHNKSRMPARRQPQHPKQNEMRANAASNSKHMRAKTAEWQQNQKSQQERRRRA